MRRKILLAVAGAMFIFPTVRADEGMWLLPLLEKINSDALAGLGSRLTPEQIYSVNNSSVKDAVVQFGGGCTGEIISDKGLLVTNHHCGYGNIQALSSEEHNYLEDGYWAMSLDEELPVQGLSVKFLQSMTDVTGKADSDRDKARLIARAEKQNPHCKATIVNFFNENYQYLVIYKIYRDVRFVGAPPAASGKFGGDTDNWMWPRHTCDFSMFRVYADKDGEPAEYSADNVPLRPRRFLSISLKGVEEGDFAMVMGYPARTQRYQTAAQLTNMLALNDIRIAARGVRQDVLWKEMRADDKVGLQYASKYAGSSNGWKKWIGMKEAFAELDVIGREEQKEAGLQEWIAQKGGRAKKYGGAIEEIAAASDFGAKASRARTLLSETLGKIEIIGMTGDGNYEAYDDYDAGVDRKVALAMVEHYIANVSPEDRIAVDADEIENIFENSVFVSAEKKKAAASSGFDASKDPASILAKKIRDKTAEFAPVINESAEMLREPARRYAAALLEWTEGEKSYPDANSTCRLSYGSVKGYEPRDGVVYRHYTTLKGVIEKEEPDNYEFRVPSRLKEIYETSDYGQYANADGELVTCFLTNLDITGGNSGSPVMDADGNLIGLAFDGNWEAMSGDVIFEPNLQRCICVDIRYVLLMMDKFGGAGYLLDEMNIVR